MEITYTHIQKRRRFGAKCEFSKVGPHLDVDIEPDPALRKTFVDRKSTDRQTQCSNDMSLHTVNTVSRSATSCGINHKVGGWPADVDPREEEQVSRYNKKIQKDENFITSIKTLCDLMENFVMENNSVDIYEEYFSDEQFEGKENAEFKTLSVYRDNCEVNRQIQNISWSLDDCKIAAAYKPSDLTDCSNNLNCHSYVWDAENCNIPYCTLLADVPLLCVEYSPRDLDLLAGGWSNGQIGLWDVRTGGRSQHLSPVKTSHKEGVSDIKWISSKTGFEFYSSSTDGKLFTWDSRNLMEPIQAIIFDENLNSSKKSYSLTCIEYDPTLPHRFMLGSEQGVLLSCNRKFKDPSEIVSCCFPTDTGPVLTIERNTFFPKLFSSCSTWGVKVWSEDLASSPVLNLCSQDGYVTDVAWSNTHASFLFITKSTGNLELWDVLIKTQDPILSFKLESDGLICVHSKQHADQIACGTANGCIHLLDVPQYTTLASKHEKNLVAAMVDREGKREKLLDGITREQRVRHADAQDSSVQKEAPEDENFYNLDDTNDPTKMENEFESQFDDGTQQVDDEIEETDMEMPFLDSQFTEALKTVLPRNGY